MRNITVTGKGRASAQPDVIELNMNLTNLDKIYARSLSKSTQGVSTLKQIVAEAGLDPTDVKTRSFDIETNYDTVRNEQTNEWTKIFKGYEVQHDLRLLFAFDLDMLNTLLFKIASTEDLEPHLSIKFTVKDDTQLKEEMLRNAAASARRNATVLTEAAQVKLGELQSISYSWGTINLYSETDFRNEEETFLEAIPFTPEDVVVNDEVTFVWEIVNHPNHKE